MARRSLDLTNLTSTMTTNWNKIGCADTTIGTKDVIESFAITNASNKPDLIKITENTDVEKEKWEPIEFMSDKNLDRKIFHLF